MDAALEVLGLTLVTNADAVAAALRRPESASVYTPLAALAAARTLSLAVDDTMRALVSVARQQGATWQEIGAVLGTTRQAAFQRFGTSATGEEAPVAKTISHAGDKAVAILERYLNKDWTIREHFDETLSERLSAELLGASYEQVSSLVGEFQAFGAPAVTQSGEHAVVDVPMNFTKGDMKGRVVYDGAEKIAGFFVLNPDVP